MQTRTVDHVESWESRPFSGGYGALHDLADDSFSGAVVADDSWLFMLNGRVVGVFEGSIEDFDDASGTVYEAPHLSLPLLFAMLEEGGETRAKYYTKDTPLPETDETLTDGNFVGYIELSENVLSGDYYTVYYAGRSMSAAFVGASGELVTGEEAFERAADEVGVYEVVSVDLDVVDIPEPDAPSEDEETNAALGAGGSRTESEPADESEVATAETASAGVSEDAASETRSERREVSIDLDGATAGATSEEASDVDAERAESAESDGRAEASADVEAEVGGDASAEAEEETASTSEPRSAVERVEREQTDEASAAPAESTATESTSAGAGSPEAERTAEEGADADEDVFNEEEAWRETTSVPAIDPEESGAVESADDGEGETEIGAEAESAVAESPDEAATESTDSTRSDADERVERLEAAVAERDERIDELEAELADAERRLDRREEELDRLRQERDDLAARVDELEEQLAAAQASGSNGDGSEDADAVRTPEEALSGTNLFVRYDSKADPTLDALEGGDATAEQINANLGLEHHTQFDATDVTVDGEPFERFLESSAPYRFVSWVVRELPYEILDTGHRNGLSDLFEAIADVDRAELDGVVEVTDDAGEERSHTFDVVLRDRMGNPLIVADVNESRDPVPGEEMEGLVEAARDVATESETLASAVYVTASFFEPGALEVADEETESGGFLRGSDKDSFVKVSRKRGFHLCLVEDRNESFHVTVPEL